jgi:hypothetical protein
MTDSLPTIPDRPVPNFQPPPPRQRIKIEAPPGPIPTQVRSGPPPNHPNWVRHDPPPHLNQNRGSNSNAVIVRPASAVPHTHHYPDHRPPPRFQEIPSTTFHIGPIPPHFTIDQLHVAMRTLNPKVALLDLKMGVMEVEIPYTLTWHQIGDCKFCSFGFRYRTDV